MNNIIKSSLQNLTVYLKAKELSKECLEYFYSLKFEKNDFLVLQLLRAITSIGANIAEGYGRYYTKNYRLFLSIARGSCFEVDYWLEIAISLKKYNNETLTEYKRKNLELIKIITTTMINLERRKQS